MSRRNSNRRFLAPVAFALTVTAGASVAEAQRSWGRSFSSSTQNMVRVEMIALQLEAYTEMEFPVEIYDTGVGGMAMSGGQIYVDPWILMMPDDILAWLTGHEWGHQALGHVTNAYHTIPKRGDTPTALEDEADTFAGGFIGFGQYDIFATTSFIRRAADESSPVHSSGERRAELTYEGYEAFLASGSAFYDADAMDEGAGDDTPSTSSGPTMSRETLLEELVDVLRSGERWSIATLLDQLGMSPSDFAKKKQWKQAMNKLYKGELLDRFPGKRDKKDKKADRRALKSSFGGGLGDAPSWESLGYGCACGSH